MAILSKNNKKSRDASGYVLEKISDKIYGGFHHLINSNIECYTSDYIYYGPNDDESDREIGINKNYYKVHTNDNNDELKYANMRTRAEEEEDLRDFKFRLGLGDC